MDRLLELLKQAHASTGRHKPVLSVGRRRRTLGQQPHGFFEVASTATVTVYDRRSQRLGAVYLGFVPEYGQGTLSQQLTLLIADGILEWLGRAVAAPLCYVTDAGDNETELLQACAAADEAPADRRETPVALDRGLLSRDRANLGAGRAVAGHGAQGSGVGQEDAQAAAETTWRGQGVVLGGGLTLELGLAKKKEKAFGRGRTITCGLGHAT